MSSTVMVPTIEENLEVIKAEIDKLACPWPRPRPYVGGHAEDAPGSLTPTGGPFQTREDEAAYARGNRGRGH